jgi:hypothetical protein
MGEEDMNADELAICKRRGHDIAIGLRDGWVQCKWCGIWLREVPIIEEREDAPPEAERNRLVEMKKRIKA